jgi:23S rRNA pseudouridine955/2504/2580 synthase
VLSDSPEEELRLVHRLDRDTSGCLVLARTRESAAALSHAFKEGTIHKTYLAIVSPCPAGPRRGTIDAPLRKRRGVAGEPDRVVAVSADPDGGGLPAVTRYHIVASSTRGARTFAVLRLEPLTGRTHQVFPPPPACSRRDGPG